MNGQREYNLFLQKWKEMAILAEVKNLLDWDQETVMPGAEADARSEQTKLLAGMVHDRMVDPALKDLIITYSSRGMLDSLEEANIYEAFRQIQIEEAIPKDLVEAIAVQNSVASEIWKNARRERSWKLFEPALTETLRLTREKAAALHAAEIGSSPYEALMQADYEHGVSLEEVEGVFSVLRERLPGIVQKVLDCQASQPDDSCLYGYFPEDFQNKLARDIISRMGFDWNAGRIDRAAHPFSCTPAYACARITTRYRTDYFGDGFFSGMHEAGHGLYDQGLPPEFRYMPVGCAGGMAIHESQSRLWEAWIGRSYEFWLGAMNFVREYFPTQVAGVEASRMYRAVNKATRGFIRVDSDPLTYNLHILLRYDLEQAMISGDLPVSDVPGAWNEKFKAYFGVVPDHDGNGALQDVHWSHGYFGYFPTYTIGNVISAQLYARMKQDIPEFGPKLENCSMFDMREWLRAKVHRHGRHFSTSDIVQRATGQEISVDVFLQEIIARYEDVYYTKLT